MTEATIGWCDKCKKEVGKDHDCFALMNVWRLKEALEADKK